MAVILSDFCRVLFFPKDELYPGKLNPLHKTLMEKYGPEYPILDYFYFNLELIEYFQKLRDKHQVHVFTTDIIQKHPTVSKKLSEWFDSVHAANDYGREKKHPESFVFIAEKLSVKPSGCIFIDDTPKNVEAAKNASMRAILYLNNEQAITEFNELLGK